MMITFRQDRDKLIQFYKMRIQYFYNAKVTEGAKMFIFENIFPNKGYQIQLSATVIVKNACKSV